MITTKQQLTLKQMLLELKEGLQSLLDDDADAAAPVKLDQSKVGRLSRMDALQQQAMAQAGRSNHQQQLRQVIRALEAMERDEYGECEECGNDIPYARLEVKPEALVCVGCQSELEEHSTA